MLEAPVQTIALSQIKVKADDRQRKTFGDIESLAGSIHRNGLINPIVIQRDGTLVAGERRMRAFQSLAEKMSDAYGKIPFRYLDTLDPNIVAAIELDENIQRHQLSWQEEVMAVLKVHELRGAKSMEDTADFLGMATGKVHRHLKLARAIAGGDKVVEGALSLKEAENKLTRALTIQLGNDVNKLMFTSREPLKPSEPLPAPAPGKPTEPAGVENLVEGLIKGRDVAMEAPKPPTPQAPAFSTHLHPVLCTDFIEWAKTYKGEPFNFIHCDFPYGINHQNSRQGRTEEFGKYADSEDVYWTLLKALAENKSRLIYPSAHIIFWFSMKHYVKTLQFFQEFFPEFIIEDYPLVWTKRQGIAPDVRRRPQRNYETALFGFSSNRQIHTLVSNVVNAAPGVKLHASQKSPKALRYFFRMVVNKDTRMLDPTCGSGTALQAAKALGAAHVLGIERDPQFAALANNDFASASMFGFAAGLNEGDDHGLDE